MKAILLFALLGASLSFGQSKAHEHSVDHRGDKVMGFSHEKSGHHFKLFSDGGAIQVTVADSSDKDSLEAIRGHLKKVAKSFGVGDLSMPMLIHNTDIPGLKDMKLLHKKIGYTYENVDGGGRVRIQTKNARALKAVHAFLKFQAKDHRTGDSCCVEKP